MATELQSIVRLEEVPMDQRYCNNCDRQIEDEDSIGDLWFFATEGDDVVVLCRDCA